VLHVCAPSALNGVPTLQATNAQPQKQQAGATPRPEQQPQRSELRALRERLFTLLGEKEWAMQELAIETRHWQERGAVMAGQLEQSRQEVARLLCQLDGAQVHILDQHAAFTHLSCEAASLRQRLAGKQRECDEMQRALQQQAGTLPHGTASSTPPASTVEQTCDRLDVARKLIFAPAQAGAAKLRCGGGGGSPLDGPQTPPLKDTAIAASRAFAASS
jgi:chromosome segregation ATPase